MKRGPKSSPPSVREGRGTFRLPRDRGTMEISQFDDLPNAPDWLTEAGKAAWLDNIGRVSATRSATEVDSDLFATYCNLDGANALAWGAGEVPPAAYIMEFRRLSELFGLAGPKSRDGQKSDGKPTGNPFSRLKG